MFETILVPMDSTRQGCWAAEEAIEIARPERRRAILHGLYVVDAVLIDSLYAVPVADGGVPYAALAEDAERLRSQLVEEGWRGLQRLAERAEAAGVGVKTELVEGSVGDTICEHASMADLVVVGRGGCEQIGSHLVFDPPIETVLRSSPQPVLVAVRQPRPVKRVLIAYDGSDRAQDALAVVANAGWAQGADVLVLCVIEPYRVGQQKLNAAKVYLREHEITPTILLLADEDPAAAILRVAEERDVDLIAMGGYGHGRVLDVVFGTTVNKVLRGTTRPVLVCQ